MDFYLFRRLVSLGQMPCCKLVSLRRVCRRLLLLLLALMVLSGLIILWSSRRLLPVFTVRPFFRLTWVRVCRFFMRLRKVRDRQLALTPLRVLLLLVVLSRVILFAMCATEKA